jgi:hypothetical protein
MRSSVTAYRRQLLPHPTGGLVANCGDDGTAIHADLTMLARLSQVSQALARARAVPLAV